jgi:hypothetical protein
MRTWLLEQRTDGMQAKSALPDAEEGRNRPGLCEASSLPSLPRRRRPGSVEHPCNGAPDGHDRAGLRQPRSPTLLQEPSAGGIEGIPREKNEPRAQGRILTGEDINWLQVFRRADATLLGSERRQPHQTRAVR